MKGRSLPRVLIAAAASGAGKTTLTCGILQALIDRGMRISAFKCGPDYIDPMFHTQVIGAQSRNLDLFFTGEEIVRGLVIKHAAKAELAVMEGVMGYYDGVGARTSQAGAYHLARATDTPAVLVVDARKSSLSLAALIKGFVDFRPQSGIAGVVFNRCSPSLYPLLQEVVQSETGIPALGFLPELPQAAFDSRHLGLVTAPEICDIRKKLKILAGQCEKTLLLDDILRLARRAPPIDAPPLPALQRIDGHPKIAVAQDRAFCFHYEDNWDLLREAGAEIEFFSPIRDAALPEGTAGLFLGGGYPELYARQLAKNAALRRAIKDAVGGGLPTVAECGGFLYLHRSLEGDDGQTYPMVGVLAAGARRTEQRGNFGYALLRAQRDNLLCRAGEQIPAHEFHYWQSDDPGRDFVAQKPVGGRTWPCVWADESLYAGFPHLYFYANPRFAQNFAAACASYAAGGAHGCGRGEESPCRFR